MDYGRSFSYMLKSGQYGQGPIGGLLLLAPIFGWAVVAGYGIRLMRGDYDHCKGCGICATECPAEAITMHPETEFRGGE